MSNLIQIKRSLNTAVPTSLANGELAYSANGNQLFIGNPDGGAVTSIGGKQFSFLQQANTSGNEGGKTTANAVVITNANNFVNEFKTNSLTVGADGSTIAFTAANTTSNATVLGNASNTELVSSWAIKNYVDEKITQTGAAADLNGLSDVQLGSLANGQILIYDSSLSNFVNRALQGNSGQVVVSSNTSGLIVSLEADLSVANTITVGNSSITTTGFTGNGYLLTSVNAATLGGNSVSEILTYANNLAANAYSNATSYADTAAGNAYSNATAFAANADNISSGTLNTARLPATANITTAVNVGGNVNLTTSRITVGNSTINTSITSTAVDIDGTLDVAGNTTLGNLSASNIDVATANVGTNSLVVNSTIVTIGTSLTVNGAILPTTNNTIDIGSNEKRFGTLYLAGNTIVLGNTLIQDDSGSLVVNNANITSDLTINGNTVLGNSSSDVVSFIASVNTSIVPAANNTYDLGSTDKRYANVYANDVISYSARIGLGGLTVDGDLTVTGNLTSIEVQTLKVEDPLLHLAVNNEISDTVDIGFIGHYSNDAGSTRRHTGLFRDATDGRFHLFDNYVDPSIETGGNIIDVSNNTFRTASLVAYIQSGALVSNSTAVAITSNGSVSVSITANSLTLGTALNVASGGTGNQSFTNNAVLFGYGTGAIQQASGANGQVLQIVNDVPTFGSLDGGSF